MKENIEYTTIHTPVIQKRVVIYLGYGSPVGWNKNLVVYSHTSSASHAQYKYELVERYAFWSGVKPGKTIDAEFYTLYTDGFCEIKKRYMWDGATGAPDTVTVMRAALEHDVLTQIFRLGMLGDRHIPIINDRFENVCREDGMSKLVYSMYRVALRIWWRVTA
jgi:hypothetical protein